MSYISKLWCRVRTRGWRFVSFEDVFRIIVHLVHCENDKYTTVSRPSIKVRIMLLTACDFADRYRNRELPSREEWDAEWRRFAKEWQMPPRAFDPLEKRWGYVDVEFTKPPIANAQPTDERERTGTE